MKSKTASQRSHHPGGLARPGDKGLSSIQAVSNAARRRQVRCFVDTLSRMQKCTLTVGKSDIYAILMGPSWT
ncbi:hypothetical protein, partial [Salmonella enterica]|uniref:hypothetical protein n=1 Tax=Salmonella enterica TaxID=28901 RepID=UPI001F4262A6